jgi:hypothetical protein
METFCTKEKTLGGSQTQEIHYLEEIAIYKIVILPNPFAAVIP